METELQEYPWDITEVDGEPVVMVDLGDRVVYLTGMDLTAMVEGATWGP